MRRILIAIDGSDNALRAVRQVVSLAPELREPPQLLLANVQPVVVSGGVRTFVNADQVDTWYRSEGEKALASARDLLAAAGLAHEHHIVVGDPAETLARMARERGCDLIVIGTRGMSAIGNLLMGSVATKVLQLVDAPVLLVR
jgi:nucleotide-binding universal stress UspA family protein